MSMLADSGSGVGGDSDIVLTWGKGRAMRGDGGESTRLTRGTSYMVALAKIGSNFLSNFVWEILSKTLLCTSPVLS